MVMHKMRASSYLRRTISEPFSRRRLSTLLSLPPRAELQEGLMQPPASELPAYIPTYTSYTDLLGLKQILSHWLYLLLVFVPIGLASGHLQWGDSITFWTNFIAMVPLAALLGTLTEELAIHTGDLVGGLVNATFGNAVEMIITVQTLRAGLIDVVQGTLLGSILSNLLLVLGMSFFAGGMYHYVQKFNAQGATCSTSLLMLASFAFITPTVASIHNPNPEDILKISRYTALLIAVTYVLFLFFQLYTHLQLFKDESNETPGRSDSGSFRSFEGEEVAAISLWTSIIGLLVVTLMVATQSDQLVGSINGVSQSSGMNQNFIGIILLPIVGNAAEHVTAVTVAIKNKPDLTMGVAVGSSTQIAMFMVPFAVLVGWGMNVPMTLAFSSVSATVLAFSTLIVIGIVQDGESNWLEGVMLIVAYFIVAIVFWFDSGSSSTLTSAVSGQL
ncbi:MAG: hypothetical protein KVP17_001974 [Porospora cf. gigantea B]|uniref:uncharacterized protein n=2 Tax=Porospora cf. gigantea B TaxID=2853592 RepID=UPI003571A7B4|nr:MAG: hypothetical protein KVP17_001974 [Porospora cf. gigantea B]